MAIKLRDAMTPEQRRASPLAAVLEERRGALILMAIASLVAGFAEALLLVTLTRAALAITQEKESVGIVASWFLSVPSTLVLSLGLLLVRICLAVLTSWQGAAITARTVASVRTELTRSFLLTSWTVQQGQQAGSLQQLLSGYSSSAGGLIGGYSQAVVAGGNLAAMLALAVAVDALGASVLIVSVGALGLMLRPVRRLIRRSARGATEASMAFATSVSEVSQLGLELHVFRVQDRVEHDVSGLIEASSEKETRLWFTSGLTSPLYTGAAYLALLGALAAVSASSAASLPDLGAVMLIMLRSLGYGQALQNGYVRIIQNIPPMEEFYSKLETFENGRVCDGSQNLERVGSLEAVGLTFSYATGGPVLRGVSFVIEPHEIVGVVGPSGSGKTTLVQLLLGLRDPDEGLILADGRDIREFFRDEWARKVTFVPQEAHLITGTIADNIRFLRDGVSAADVERAARMAHIHDEITALPDGYQAPLGAEGGRLSGGQQQRLCIARALVEHPDVLILDEPTSALDVRSEHLIRSTLLSLKDRMTVIVIAHRLSTLEICDRIMVIQGGRLKGFDTPANLEQSNDFYREALHLSGLR